MPTEASLLVCKPQVQFSQRLTDPDLRRLTVAQLHKVARGKKLDVSLLTHKWELIHVLVQECVYGIESHVQHVTDRKRCSIFDLPGEIRNKIYGFILSETVIMVQYNYPMSRSEREDVPDWFRGTIYDRLLNGYRSCERMQPESPAIAQLRNMSWANRRLRVEVRGFFFANNRFRVSGDKAASHGDFLNDIGSDGRTNIATFELVSRSFWKYSHNYESMLVTCTGLRDLTVRMHAGHILTKRSYESLRECADKFFPEPAAVEQIDVEIGDRIALFSRLPALDCLKLKCAVPNWRCHAGIMYSILGHDDTGLKAMQSALKTALSQALEKCLKGKDVSITIDIVVGAPELAE